MQYIWLVCLLLSDTQAQSSSTASPEWNGDPTLCTVNTSTPPTGPPLPIFPTRAEFTLERVEIKHVLNLTLPSELTMYEYIYDYDANKVIIVKNRNGVVNVDYFYYNTLKKSSYYRNNFCVVDDIPINHAMDGASAIQLPNGTWHVRPLNEFILFSSDDLDTNRPRYIGQGIVRGIPVDQWETCFINKTEMRTVRRTWSFASKNVIMPFGIVEDKAVPVQGLISASIVLPNGTQVFEFDEVFNILSYEPRITQNANSLAPPKGVFCSFGPGQALVSLSDAGISWPRRFSVKVDASSSRSSTWQSFQLRIDQDRERKRIRYDYMPAEVEGFRTILLDYKDNLTYSIDRQMGSCDVIAGTEYGDVIPTSKPIEFFIKHQNMLFSSPSEKAWEFKGIRKCRGKTVCSILTTSVDRFPAIVDSDTNKPTGEFWQASNIEYGWSSRSPLVSPPPGQPKQFDYPVYLYLKMYRYDNPNAPSPLEIRTEDIGYEFYEMSDDVHMNEFDTSICYRSLDLPYVHLGFVLKPTDDSLVDNNHLDRRDFEKKVEQTLVIGTQVSRIRITNIELDHIRFDKSIYVLFTLLGSMSPANKELSVETAQANLNEIIDAGKFTFNLTSLDDDRLQTTFKAQANSLKVYKQFMSIHASSIYANVSNCTVPNPNATTAIVSTTTVNTVTVTTTTVSPITVTTAMVSNCSNSNFTGQRIRKEKYTTAAQAGGIIGGLTVGIILGFVVMVIFRFTCKEPKKPLSSIISGGLNNVGFSERKPLPPLTMKNLRDDATTTSDT